MHSLELRESIESKFKKISKKDKKQMIIIEKKISQILSNPYMFKPLKAPLNNLRRVHVMKSFVLIYSINEKEKSIIIEAYEHHDKAYK